MKKTVLRRFTASLLLFSSLLGSALGCSAPSSGNNGGDKPKLPWNAFDINGYSIVYSENADDKTVRRAEKLAESINKKWGGEIPLTTDATPDNGAKEILVGNTNRESSVELGERLRESGNNDAYAVEIAGVKVAILGMTASSTMRAVEYFIREYVSPSEYDYCIDISKGKSIITPFDAVKTIVLDNGVELDIELVSTVFQVPDGGTVEVMGHTTAVKTAHYPSVIELQHNGENNGKLIGIFCLGDTPQDGSKATASCVVESDDGGATWRVIARPYETIDQSITGISMAHIYELPTQVGNMREGTLLYTGNSVNYSRKSHIAVWKSEDCGKTWREYVVIAEGGGTREGVWEPFMYYNEKDGYLYCFYSDDSDPAHDQKLVYKRTLDGVSWSEATEVCAFEEQKDRPGMLIMTKMGVGPYFMVYEYFGSKRGDVYYKMTGDITDWNPDSPGTKLQLPDGYALSGAPSCIWSPAGGKNGVLIVSGKHELRGNEIITHPEGTAEEASPRLFISFDRGATWEAIDNFLPYNPGNDALDTNRIGHSSAFFVGEDPSVIYYMSCTDTPETGRQRIQFARVRIYEA